MKVLAIETSSLVVSVAVVEPKILIAEYVLNQERNHSEKMVPAIEMVMNDSREDIKNIDVFAVAHGPGSFTGLRIGVAAIKALAQAFNRPVVGVSTLDGLAFNLAFAKGLICPIMDARRQQVYTSVYKWSEKGLTRLEEYMALPVRDLISLLDKWDEPVNFCGDGTLVYRDIIEKEMGNRAICPADTCPAARLFHCMAGPRKGFGGPGPEILGAETFLPSQIPGRAKFGSFDD